MNPALVVVDMQKWFLDEDPSPFDEKLLPNVQAALSVARAARIPIVHVITRYRRDRTDWPRAWAHRERIWCLEGTEGVQIIADVAPLAGERTVVKTRFSSFYDTELDRVLRGLGVDSLFLAGYASDVCVRMTAMDAYNRGYLVYLLPDCVHPAKEDARTAIEYLRWLTNARTISIAEMEAVLPNRSLKPSIPPQGADFDDQDHERFMREALAEAERALQYGERPIGAVVVHDGVVVGRGRAEHRRRGSEIAHAEMNALLQAEQYIHAHLHKCALYTTVEPCVMCLGAIVMSDIDHVVFALPDRWIHPAQMLDMAYVRKHIVHYLGGVLEAESAALWEQANPRELRMLRGK